MKDCTGLEIRPFSPADQEAAKELVLAGMKEHWGWIDYSANPDLDDIAESYAEGQFACAWIGETIVGTGAIVPEPPDSVRIVRMSVSHAYRRAGIGSKILSYLLDVARLQGQQHAVLETTETWVEVIAFYLRRGFQETHRSNGGVHFVLDL